MRNVVFYRKGECVKNSINSINFATAANFIKAFAAKFTEFCLAADCIAFAWRQRLLNLFSFAVRPILLKLPGCQFY
jgi:hypothetical protein